jgi:hypothetical protein
MLACPASPKTIPLVLLRELTDIPSFSIRTISLSLPGNGVQMRWGASDDPKNKKWKGGIRGSLHKADFAIHWRDGIFRCSWLGFHYSFTGRSLKLFHMSDEEKQERIREKEERIREINRRLVELDSLLAKYIDDTVSDDVSNPRVISDSELQFWKDRRQEREMLLALRDRLTKS